ncbi:hypothetical protein [Streptomyces sp. NPDC020681]|uniref:hypothetical protein n=1 Tax=Streptomyces sp. NPDC020681 TaxID=3365083 RepID=UPI0037957D67
MNLRMIGIATVVVLTALLPLTASAGDGKPGAGSGSGSEVAQKAETMPQTAAAPGLVAGLVAEPEPASEPQAEATARCGPELASPEGVEAQTCMLTEAGDTWARTYYRNATGEELSSVLTLMAPGGRTLQINCVVEPGDEPGICETPREPTRGVTTQYSAVAEFASAEDAGEGPLLLRSGSNSPTTEGR